jgi:hypothetical protein
LKALVIGGTGPSGHYIVNGLLRRGYDVAMLHSGKHELDEIPATVEHIHTDAFSADEFRGSIGSRTFDLTVAAYGRLRRIAEIMKGRTRVCQSLPPRMLLSFQSKRKTVRDGGSRKLSKRFSINIRGRPISAIHSFTVRIKLRRANGVSSAESLTAAVQ